MTKSKNWRKIFILLSMLAFAYHLVHLTVVWTDIPDQIAIHFTNGEADGWGSKYLLLLIPVISFCIWWVIGQLTKDPAKFNYINLTDKNREKQHNMASKVMSMIQSLVLIAMVFANESFLSSAIGTKNDPFYFLSIASIVLMLFVIIFNVIWSVRLKE